ncbi:MAG TPA: L,D-transpeptidase [Bauldia sp.]|nr:L,D-transpeptidase [Bauldia sp.]
MKAYAFALAAVALTAVPASASTILAKIDLSEQQMTVYVNGWQRYSWPVSTARRGYVTPVGEYHPQRLAEMWYSRKYDNSPMPHSIFFKGGYAIHGTEYVKRLGTPASHGCVRLHPDNAATLFDLVKMNGTENMDIQIEE